MTKKKPTVEVGRAARIDHDEFRRMWEAGINMVEMAERFHVQPTTVSRIAVALELPARRKVGRKPVAKAAPEPRPKPPSVYERIVSAAEHHGITIRQATCRFHRGLI